MPPRLIGYSRCMVTRTIPAGEFKAKCLALLDEVAAGGMEIVVTKRGRPVAKISRAVEPEREVVDLSKSVLYEADDAFDSHPELWADLE